MTNVPEAVHTVNFDRQAWREAVAEVVEKAKAALPQCNGRIEKAMQLVLNGDVELLGDGTARVASQSKGETVYHIVNGHCDCKDYPKAYKGWCKHRLGAALSKRVGALVRSTITLDLDPEVLATPAPVQSPALPCPEAAFSLTLKGLLDGIEALFTVRGQTAAEFQANLAAVRGLLDPPLLKSAAPGTAEAGDSTPQCPLHGVPMTQNHKDGRSWWSHKTATGWCKGR